MSVPTVSVIVTAHRRTKFLADALHSIKRQTQLPDEVVVVEDNPPYGAPSIDPPGLPYRWTNRGDLPTMGDKVAFGLSLARGDLVAFLEDDDRFDPEKIVHVVEVFQDHPEVVFLRNRLAYIGPNGDPLPPPSPIRYHPEGLVPPIPSAMSRGLMTLNMSAMSVRRSVYLPALGFYRDCSVSADIVTYWLSAYLGGSAWYSPRPLTEYRFHGQNASQTRVVEVTLSSHDLSRRLVTKSRPGTPAFRLAQSIERSQRVGSAMASGRFPGPSDLVGQTWDAVVRLSAIHFLRVLSVYRSWEKFHRSSRPAHTPGRVEDRIGR
ncbi:MAG: glycosyltransferase family 2 protein [Thermoplasmata archaeon]